MPTVKKYLLPNKILKISINILRHSIKRKEIIAVCKTIPYNCKVKMMNWLKCKIALVVRSKMKLKDITQIFRKKLTLKKNIKRN
jgi:hypothetical protein